MGLVREWRRQVLRASVVTIAVPGVVLVGLALTAGAGIGSLRSLGQIVSGPGQASSLDSAYRPGAPRDLAFAPAPTVSGASPAIVGAAPRDSGGSSALPPIFGGGTPPTRGGATSGPASPKRTETSSSGGGAGAGGSGNGGPQDPQPAPSAAEQVGGVAEDVAGRLPEPARKPAQDAVEQVEDTAKDVEDKVDKAGKDIGLPKRH